MKKSILAKVLQYDVPERILLVEDIWDSIANVPEAVHISDSKRKELDHRLEAYHSDPTTGDPWKVVKKRIKNVIFIIITLICLQCFV
jgi:putative addiction module component (TIGR02574 family)